MITPALVTILFFFHLPLSLAELPPNYTFVHNATEAPLFSFYDYIVIGGGTAGIPLATTLSQNYSVLLLERGASPYGNPNITSVFNFGSYFGDTSPNSPSQQFIVEGVINARPRVLGGGTSINAGFYSRGQAEFNVEAKLTDENLVEESYQWVEKTIVFEPVVGPWVTALEASLLEAGVTPYNGFTLDHLVGTKIGGTIFDANGERHTAADLLQYANPQKLDVLIHATVQKILFLTFGWSRPKAYGVVFQDSLGRRHWAFLKGGAKDEIILSAGAIGSPQLLLLSGIGPKEQLDALGVDVILDQPLVGHNFADNPQNAIFVPAPVDVERSTIQIVGITEFGGYIESAGGVNFLFAPNMSAYQGFNYSKGGFVFEKPLGPLSMGNLKLANLDPADNPNITFNYFKDPKDLARCVNTIDTMLTAIESETFSNYKLSNMTRQDILDLNMKLPYNFIPHANTSSSLEEYCIDTKRSFWHYHGGCHIGEVIDDDYKVIGVDRLRVVDGSTLFNSPGTNPQASLLMLGRYMGVTILTERLATADKPYSDM